MAVWSLLWLFLGGFWPFDFRLLTCSPGYQALDSHLYGSNLVKSKTSNSVHSKSDRIKEKSILQIPLDWKRKEDAQTQTQARAQTKAHAPNTAAACGFPLAKSALSGRALPKVSISPYLTPVSHLPYIPCRWTRPFFDLSGSQSWQRWLAHWWFENVFFSFDLKSKQKEVWWRSSKFFRSDFLLFVWKSPMKIL